MKTTQRALLLLFLAPPSICHAQDQPSVAAQRAAIKKLDFLVGKWFIIPTKPPMKLVLTLFLAFLATPAQAQWWTLQTSGLDTNLRSVSVAYMPPIHDVEVVVWASGSNGVILRSIDEGKKWRRLHVKGGDALDFRGIVAFDANVAYVMSSGPGDRSRIYKTTNAGETWERQYTGTRKEIFLDSLACFSGTECFALSDPVDGKFLLFGTADGRHWNPLSSDKMPAASPGEGAFAASNTCLALFEDGSDKEIYFATGGPAARVFHSSDLGRTWTVAETPIAHGNASSGIFSISATWSRTNNIVIVGGDYQDPKRGNRIAAYSSDGGKRWQPSAQDPSGYRSAVASIHQGVSLFAVGPTGEEFSEDQGVHWKRTDSLDLNALAILDIEHGWAVGPHGTIARFVNHYQYEIRSRSPLGPRAHVPLQPLPASNRWQLPAFLTRACS